MTTVLPSPHSDVAVRTLRQTAATVQLYVITTQKRANNDVIVFVIIIIPVVTSWRGGVGLEFNFGSFHFHTTTQSNSFTCMYL